MLPVAKSTPLLTPVRLAPAALSAKLLLGRSCEALLAVVGRVVIRTIGVLLAEGTHEATIGTHFAAVRDTACMRLVLLLSLIHI